MKRMFTLLMSGLPVSCLLAAAGPLHYSRDIRPILSANCFKCHGPDEETRKAGLRLDQREVAVATNDGITAIVPGNPKASELVRRILSGDPDELMPPPETNKHLTEAEKERLQQWIEQGAEYERHWAFVPPARPELPALRKQGWPLNPIDTFILGKLEAAGLEPAPEADRLALVRRVYLDLIGLPPTVQEAEAFLRDTAPDAYEQLVERLLESDHYGERWARRWLDLARYADSNGYEKDRDRSIWPYRDWVIRALNSDMPFDQFTLEQLAGDMLPSPTLDQLVATGFHRNTMLNEEGGIDPLEYRFHAMTDRVATTGTTWLGLTLGCAQCHTHKYDPITHRDYYQVMALLNNADEPELDMPDPRAIQRQEKHLEQAKTILEELPGQWPLPEPGWEAVAWEAASADNGETPRRLEDESALFAAATPDKAVYTFAFTTTNASVDRLRLDTLTHPDLPSRGPGRVKHGNFVLTGIQVTAAAARGGAQPREVRITSATASIEQPGLGIQKALDGNPGTGWGVHDPNQPLNEDRYAVFTFAKPVEHEGGTRFTVELAQLYGGHHTMGRVRLSLPAVEDPGAPPLAQRRREAFEKAFASWRETTRQAVAAWTPLPAASASANVPSLTALPDGSILASGDTSKSDTYEITFRNLPARITALRLEALPDEQLPAHGPGLTYYEGEKGDFFLTEFILKADGKPVAFKEATESYAKNRFGDNPVSAGLAIDGDRQTGWSVSGRVGERHVAVFVPTSPLDGVVRMELTMHFGRHFASSLGKFRVSVTDAGGRVRALDMAAEAERLLGTSEGTLTEAEWGHLREAFLLQAPEVATEAARIRDLRKRESLTTTLIMRERPPEHPRETFVHHRGEFLQPTKKVMPGVPAVFVEENGSGPRTRLEFARWLFSEDNPLTARVVVNRQWSAFFGRGLVRTVQDFGMQGELPSHPEVLDWLAVEFRDSGWSLKHVHRLIVLSATYRQSSDVSERALGADPDNRLLSRAPRLRLEAEILRDQILKASGLLSEKMYGPPVRPPQPSGVTEVAYGSPKWNPSAGEDRYRRSLYTFQKRTAPFAMFNTFDAPSGEACVALRDRSNSPLQALTLLNDVMLVEAAQALGRQLVEVPTDDAERVRLAFRRVLVRPPNEEEVALMLDFLKAQRARFASGDLDAVAVAGQGDETVERAAWTSLARALFNLDEAVMRN